jgi:hypothetical protein
MKDDTTSEPDNEKDIKREPIPKCVRNALWINYFKNQREGKCQCCLREIISIGNFHANGGISTLDNLVLYACYITPQCLPMWRPYADWSDRKKFSNYFQMAVSDA